LAAARHSTIDVDICKRYALLSSTARNWRCTTERKPVG
jgi:hypothetical protein